MKNFKHFLQQQFHQKWEFLNMKWFSNWKKKIHIIVAKTVPEQNLFQWIYYKIHRFHLLPSYIDPSNLGWNNHSEPSSVYSTHLAEKRCWKSDVSLQCFFQRLRGNITQTKYFFIVTGMFTSDPTSQHKVLMKIFVKWLRSGVSWEAVGIKFCC